MLNIAAQPMTRPSDWTSEEWDALVAALTRRRFLSTSAAFALAAMLAACGGDDAAPTTTPEPNWQYTDDLGVTVNLPRRPERVVCSVNMASSLWDLGIRPIAIFGSFTRTDGTNEPMLGSVDVSSLELLTEGWGELDL
ncbi:MAG: hypothetical protein M9890_00010 [Thermomicrobiales bacterium]|nr:hypothetical protein [Thermomicrobiales bacterium]